MRRSKRLKAKNNAIQDGQEFSQDDKHNESEENEDLDVKSLVQKTYEFMISKMADTREERETNSKSVELPEFLSLRNELKRMAKDPTELASELQTGIDNSDLYLKFDVIGSNSSKIGSRASQPVESEADKEIMKKCVITPDFEKRDTAPVMHRSRKALRRQRKKEREETAGPKWYNLPATKLTPELKQELKLLKMRNVLDKKRHYKSNDTKTLPKYFQIGTVVEGAADFYSSRVPKRERKQRLIDQLLADDEFRRYNKKKYLEIQACKQSGRRGKFYKKKMNNRKSGGNRR